MTIKMKLYMYVTYAVQICITCNSKAIIRNRSFFNHSTLIISEGSVFNTCDEIVSSRHRGPPASLPTDVMLVERGATSAVRLIIKKLTSCACQTALRAQIFPRTPSAPWLSSWRWTSWRRRSTGRCQQWRRRGGRIWRPYRTFRRPALWLEKVSRSGMKRSYPIVDLVDVEESFCVFFSELFVNFKTLARVRQITILNVTVSKAAISGNVPYSRHPISSPPHSPSRRPLACRPRWPLRTRPPLEGSCPQCR